MPQKIWAQSLQPLQKNENTDLGPKKHLLTIQTFPSFLNQHIKSCCKFDPIKTTGVGVCIYLKVCWDENGRPINSLKNLYQM